MTDTTPRPAGRLSLDQLREHIERGEIDTVLPVLTSPQGQLKGKLYDAGHFLARVAAEGAELCAYVLACDIDMTPVDGFALASWDTGYQDLVIRPDPDTIRVLPWMPGTALVHVDAVGHDGRPVPVAPRRMLRHQLDRLAELGLRAKVGLETEFLLCQGTHREQVAALRPVTEENLDYALDHNPPTRRFLRTLHRRLAGAGLPVEAIKTEGAPGQIEVTFPYGDALPAADAHPVFKHAVRDIAEQDGLAATFMAAPATGLASGLHLHLSLWRSGRPVFADSDGEPSAVAHQAIAGLLDALPGLAPLYAPTVNSYKRFAPHSFAPTHFTWGRDNRGCAVRVVGHGAGLHLEIRLPGADANPYLALAAAVAAIVHGIDGGLRPPPAHRGDAYRAPDAPPVPATLEAALAAFRDSAAARRAFGLEVVEHYDRLGRTELDALRFEVTDAERRRGFARV